MTTEQLAALSTELRTQDNAITADPLFVVFQEERVYGVSQNYQTNGFTWVGVDDSSVTADDDESKVLDKLYDEDRELSIGGVTFERVWYRIVPRFVTACLTRKGAEAFIACNGHNLTNPYIYVESMYRNAEMIALRNHLMGRLDTMKPVIQKRRLYFTMVFAPKGLQRAGNAYATKQDARAAVPLVRGSWRGLRVTISQCTLVWHDGVLTAKSVDTLSRKYNLEPPCST